MELSTYPQIEGYNLLETIGRGGMGVVYRARQASTGRHVALKFLKEPVGLPRDRFLREIRICLKLAHPNIVEILDCGERGSLVYFSMELIEGRTLHELLEDQGRFPVGEILAAASQSFAAIAHCHEIGVLHRDIKTNNIMRDRHDRVVLMDLGLASGEGMDVLTQTGVLMGTPRYMAPELIVGEKASAASDLYAWGVTLYELAVGKPPFDGRNLMEIAQAITHDEVRPLGPLRPDLPPDFAALVDRLLHKDPAKRATAMEVRKVLETVPASARIDAAPAAPKRGPRKENAPEARRSARRLLHRPGFLGLAAVAAAGLGALAVLSVIEVTRATRPPEPPTAVATAPPVSPEKKLADLSARLLAFHRELRRADDIADERIETPEQMDELVHQSMVRVGELRSLIEEARAIGQDGPHWLDIEFAASRAIRFMESHVPPRRYPALRSRVDPLAAMVTPPDASRTFRGCCERLLSLRLDFLVSNDLAARFRRSDVYLEVCDVLDGLDPAWRESLRGYAYRINLLQKVTDITGRPAEFVDREVDATTSPGRLEETRLRLLSLVEKGVALCRPGRSWKARDEGAAEQILECGRQLSTLILAEDELRPGDPGRRARAARLLALCGKLERQEEEPSPE